MASPPETATGPDSAPGAGPGAEELAAWMALYGPGLRRYFSRRANPAEADDLVQEVFLKLQARGDGAAVDNVERYLFTIAKNVLVSRYRHERTDGLWRHGDLEETREPADDLSPERILSAKQEISRAVVAILNLPPRTRAVFEAHRFERLSFSAIAVRMGISKSSVQVLMQRAIERLLDEMERDR